jgi:hypothetical protein
LEFTLSDQWFVVFASRKLGLSLRQFDLSGPSPPARATTDGPDKPA